MPFIPTDGSFDNTIDNFTFEKFYYLQSFTQLNNVDVEDETKYSVMQKMLIAELVCVELLTRKTLENVAGVNGQAASAGKRIKKGKADVVEAEFDYGKASDGTFLGKTSAELIEEHSKKACEYAAILGYNLPMCAELGLCKIYDAPPFISYVNNNNCGC